MNTYIRARSRTAIQCSNDHIRFSTKLLEQRKIKYEEKYQEINKVEIKIVSTLYFQAVNHSWK